MFELDHIFVATPNPDAAVAELESHGLVLGHRGPHPNQGTANAVFFFDNVYIELLWVHDVVLASQPVMAQSTLPTRLAWPVSRASPFGISLRHADGQRDTPLPIPTWGWQAPFLPMGAVPIPIGVNSNSLLDPLVFVSLVTQRPDRRNVTRQQAIGLHEVTGLYCRVEEPGPLADELIRLSELGIATFELSREPRLQITIDGGRQGRRLELSEIPLDIVR
jgi:Glyoxalase-like domain